MKRYLIILALCGSVYAGDYCDDDYSEQLKRIERQQEDILRRQRQAESDAQERAKEQKERDYWNKKAALEAQERIEAQIREERFEREQEQIRRQAKQQADRAAEAVRRAEQEESRRRLAEAAQADRELRESYRRSEPPYSNDDKENLAFMNKTGLSQEAINLWLSDSHEERKRLFGPQIDQSKWVFTEEEGEEKIRRGEWILLISENDQQLIRQMDAWTAGK
jgi:hypothetical protein